LRPDVTIIGSQAEQAAAYPPSLAAGAPRKLEHMHTMADGIAVGLPGEIPFALVRDYVDDIVTVTENELSRAVLLLLERTKLLVEPAGAAAAAAVLANPKAFTPPVAVVLSGGNVDPIVLLRIVRHGLVAAGRYLTISVRLSDSPGSLAELLEEVSHDRIDPGLGVDEVDIVVQLETRGEDHCRDVVDQLTSAGYQVERI
jgi:threonine dehydratase